MDKYVDSWGYWDQYVGDRSIQSQPSDPVYQECSAGPSVIVGTLVLWIEARKLGSGRSGHVSWVICEWQEDL